MRFWHSRATSSLMAFVQIATEKKPRPHHRDGAGASGIRRKPAGGTRSRHRRAHVFTGKEVRGRVLPMNKKAWAAKFKKYAVLAGVNEPKKSCHGVRKARTEVAAYADCTESQMMAMFGWTDPKMPADYIAQANREKLGMSGMDKIVANRAATNRVVTCSKLGKKA